MTPQTATATATARPPFIEAAPRAVPVSPVIGADVNGLDLDDLTPDSIRILKQAVLDHCVVRLRGYTIDDDRLVELGRLFGAPVMSLLARLKNKVYIAKHPELFVVSNIKEDGSTVGELGDGELVWHTDMGFDDVPPSLSMLLALEVPAKGGDTGFANMYLAYETLPAALRARVEKLKLRHQLSHDGSGKVRIGFEQYEGRPVSELPGPAHPIVRTHPETGRKTIYLGRRFGGWILGLPIEESEALLNELWAHSTRPEITWHQQWQVGDLIIWDNRCALHRRDSFDASERRRMHRYVVMGSKPY